ncbi:Clavaminate synthase-like protein [Amylocystis lapponica]|nr:Clavaminate synthase-like protein [Amylocystis lapponica]
MPGLTLNPPFPDDVPTHPLLIIDYDLLVAGNEQEIARLWDAATHIGFWYLKNHRADELVDGMFEMGAATMALPFEEKMKYEQGDGGESHGYKCPGGNNTDETGARDTVEFINISKDDALAYPRRAKIPYPSTVNERMSTIITPFVRRAIEVDQTILAIFEKKLGLVEGTLAKFHTDGEFSDSEARAIKNPPRPGGISEQQAAIGAHTDVGSLTFLHNRLGGLQVMVPGTDNWKYVKPLPGCAVCNVGDSLNILSGGLLKSNLHRVVPAPGAQAVLERWSVAFFLRPGDSTPLHALADESPLIDESVKVQPNQKIFQSGETQRQWFLRRTKLMRAKNRTGAETWRASRGTEHRPDAI